ncbi:MAG TPA: TatD family hydrolase [Candidatus Limnocylindria bacterium]|nr:TatD family hydrolase [Candidatus Limnocylindria bacterium]
MGLADVHAHVTHPALAARLETVVARARAAGVTTVIANGLNPADNAAIKALAAREPLVRPAYGFYPVDTVLAELKATGNEYYRDSAPVTADEGVAWVEAHAGEAFAIGEIGLDGHWVPEALWEKQEAVFRRLLRIARAADKPVILHTRRRERRALEIVEELGVRRVDWHCFGGKVNLARQIAERGHYFSIPANARRSESFTRMLQTLPRDRLLLETDCPYLGPERNGGSEPADVAGTAAYAAELWGVSVTEVEARLAENFARLFGAAP